MGSKKAKKSVEKQLRRYTEEAAALLDELLTDFRARAERHAEVLTAAADGALTEATRIDVELHQQLRETESSCHEVVTAARRTIGTSVEAAVRSVRSVADDAEDQIHAVIGRIEASRDEATRALDEARAATIAATTEVDEQVRSRIEPVEREVEQALIRLEALRAQLDAEAGRIEERTRALDKAQAVAVPEHEADEVEVEDEDEDQESEPIDERDGLSWSAQPASVAVEDPLPTASEPFVVEPGSPSPASHHGTGSTLLEAANPTPAATQLRTTMRTTSRAAVAFRTSKAQLHASVAHLARTAADGWLHIEVVNDVSRGSPGPALRLIVRDVVGTWEYHDVRGQASSAARPDLSVDAKELLQALELDRCGGDGVELVLDGDVTVGPVLVPGRTATTALPEGTRRKVERVELPSRGLGEVTVDTLLGRLVVPSRVTSSLRSRRAEDVDLVTFDDRPYLVARVPGPIPEVTATIITPMQHEAAPLDSTKVERRHSTNGAVSQLFSALSASSSPDELVALVANGVGYARRRAAAHPALPAGVIAELLHDGTEAMRSAAAANPSIPVDAIERAVQDDAPSVRAAVAVNPAVPPTLLFQLARDDAAEVRSRLARNPALPPEMLGLLVDDPEPSVRAAVAAHASCRAEDLATLAADAFPRVCASVALNPKCTPELLEELLGVVPEIVLSNPRTPAHVLTAGSQVASARLRAAVAANPSTPTRELQALARDDDHAVVRAVVSNPNAPAGVQRRALRRSERRHTSRRSKDST